MGTVLAAGLDQPSRTLLERCRPSAVTVEETVTTGETLVGRLRVLGDELDAVVVGPTVVEPVRIAQRVRMADSPASVVVIAPPERYDALARALRFAPLVGQDVRCLRTGPGDAQALTTALAEAERRRQSRLAFAAANARIAAFTPTPVRPAEYLDRLLDHAPIGILTVDADGAILTLNPKASDLLGAAERDALGQVLTGFFEAVDRERLAQSIQGTARAAPHSTVLRRPIADGPPRLLEVTAAPLAGRSSGASVMVLLQDVTARVAAERARDEFLSIAAHELKTPVAVVKANAQLLLRAHEQGRLDPERLGRGVASIANAANRLAALTDDLLDVARLRADRLPLRRTQVDLAALTRATVAQMRDRLQAGHALRLRIDEDPCHVEADPARIEQVLTNLLENAVKYMPRGGTISVGLAAEGDGVRVSVQDEGIGLTPGHERTIFEPFGRSPNAVVHHLPGLGLGLYISRDIVERHGGRIRAESGGEDRGTTVSFWLPRHAAAG